MKHWIGMGWLVLMAPALQAAEAPASEADEPSCVEVEVNGHRALPYDCLQRKMMPAAVPEAAKRDNPALDSADVTRLPPNRTGQFNQSALRNRMGNALGSGVKPQRPPR
ncbi:MAG: hypothetical protein H2067_15655 [Alcanivorax sp.]|nr:hypothetical protein [Alcanivorax sp.]